MDNVGTTGMTWGRWGRHVETTWGPSIGYGDNGEDGDDVGTTETMWGPRRQCGDHRDDVGTTGTTWG